MSKLETNTIDNISGSSTLTIGDSNASTISIPKNITLGASGTTITVPSGATITNNGTQTGFGGVNTPAFLAQKTTGTQTISNTTNTQVTFDNEVFDTNNNFASNTFTPTTAGKYYLYGQVGFSSFSDQALGILYIKQNSTLISETIIRASSIHSFNFSTEIIAVANSGDNFIVQVYQDTGGSKDLITSSRGTYFYGYKIIE